MKKIKNFHFYYITDDGRVWSERSKKFLISTHAPYGNQVKLSGISGEKTFYVHILVANAYLPNPYNLSDVKFKGNNYDCRVENLEWDYLNFKHNKRSVIVLNVNTGIYYDSIESAAKSENIKGSLLCYKLKRANKNNTNFIVA